MKTTMLMRPIANPRRTTLAHLKDADSLTAEVSEQATGEAVEEAPALPQQTANPRRTVLDELPTA